MKNAPASSKAKKPAPERRRAAAKARNASERTRVEKRAAPARAAKSAARSRAASPAGAAKTPRSSQGSSRRSPTAATESAAKKWSRRADLGAPVEGFFEKHPAPLRAVLEALRGLIDKGVPDATAAIKWGMPFYSIGREPVCALAAFKSHVNLILAGPPGAFADPEGLLEGSGKTGRHLKIRSIDELPREKVRAWLAAASAVARETHRAGG